MNTRIKKLWAAALNCFRRKENPNRLYPTVEADNYVNFLIHVPRGTEVVITVIKDEDGEVRILNNGEEINMACVDELQS